MKHQTIITRYLNEIDTSLQSLDQTQIATIVTVLLTAYKHNKTVFIFGNGGSASIASHMACDLGKGTLRNNYDMHQRRLRAVSLTDNVATITAYGNDVSYDDIFIQQLRNLVNSGDVVIAISASGDSKNVLKTLQYAKSQKAITIGLLGFGTGGKAARIVDHALIVNSKTYGVCEDVYSIINHILTTAISHTKYQYDK